MTRDETVALFLECEAKRAEARSAALGEGKNEYDAENIAHEAAKAHWNAWAEGLLAERKAMEADGRWAAERNILGLEPKNAETQAWMKKAAADFSRCLEGKTIRFNGFVFPGDAGFGSATLSGTADFGSATFSGTADFRSATFSGDAGFWGATFSGPTDFGSATFGGTAYFWGATFSGTANFVSATFSGNADFGSATFSGDAGFKSAAFSGNANFRSATFSGDAYFESAAFSGNAGFRSAAFSGDAGFWSATFSGNAGFQSATFKSSTAFGEAKFKGEADFTGVKVERAFEMMGAEFEKVPAFSQADFKQAPDLDDVKFPLPGFWRKGERRLIPLYRALRRIAIQGSDYEREQMAFKGELRARRWVTTYKRLSLGTWFGILYDGLADCGRSLVRPLVLWLALVALFPAIYLQNAGVPARDWREPCATTEMRKWERAVSVSLSAGMPLIGGSRSEEAREFQACVGRPGAGVPLSLAVLQVGQSLASTALIFLLLLALKNRFKIK